jgi:ubiquinol-cytochrome c reductase cytochrome c1 subunit
MRTLIFTLITALFPLAASASAEVHLDHAKVNLHNQASLQRGAKYFVNYCLSCHSAAYLRYNRLAAGIGVSEAQVAQNLMFAAEKVGDPMTVAIRAKDAAKWFGTAPPDLTVVSRSRGEDWLYTYLRTFYLDPHRPFGVNNATFKDVAMPDVLATLEGVKQLVEPEGGEAHGAAAPKFELVQLGTTCQAPYQTMTKGAEGVPAWDKLDGITKASYEQLRATATAMPAWDELAKGCAKEYDQVANDLVTFMSYMGEPAQLERRRLGVFVLLFLAVFLVFAYLLKKEYWKDIH